jgi:hypothetical protein
MAQLNLFGEYEIKIGHRTITTFYNAKRGKWILLKQTPWSCNRETFYNEKNEMMEWKTEEEAIVYIEGIYNKN